MNIKLNENSFFLVADKWGNFLPKYFIKYNLTCKCDIKTFLNLLKFYAKWSFSQVLKFLRAIVLWTNADH